MMSYQDDIVCAIISKYDEMEVNIVVDDNNHVLDQHELIRNLHVCLKDVFLSENELQLMDEIECLNMNVNHWKALAMKRGTEAARLSHNRTDMYSQVNEKTKEMERLKETIKWLRLHVERISQENKGGYVYLMQRSNGDTKIGVSKNPSRRLEEIKKDHPSAILMYQMKADEAYKAEKLLHKEFSERRKDSEWFTLSENDIKSITVRNSFQDGAFYVPMNSSQLAETKKSDVVITQNGVVE